MTLEDRRHGRSGRHGGAASPDGARLARRPGERGQGRCGPSWRGSARGGSGAVGRRGEAGARRRAWLRRRAVEAAARARADGKVATGIFFSVVRLSSPPNATEKEIEKSPEGARDPLTGRSGGSDRTLPPSVRSIPERSKTSRIGTGRVRWSMTGRRQGPVGTT